MRWLWDFDGTVIDRFVQEFGMPAARRWGLKPYPVTLQSMDQVLRAVWTPVVLETLAERRGGLDA
jgi:hypothetical protein